MKHFAASLVSFPRFRVHVWALGAALAALSGCAAPEASFTAFGERYDKIFANKPPTACPDAYVPLASGQADGKYLLALSATLKPDQPLVFLAEVTTPTVNGAVGLAFTVTPLSKSDRKTPAGDPQVYEAVPIDDSGKFEMELPLIAVPADANTIIPTKVEANIKLVGNVCGDASFTCGDVTGSTVSPAANLEGSTFTLIRIEDESKYPDVVIDCEETPAAAPIPPK